jgi:hypothetical protein
MAGRALERLYELLEDEDPHVALAAAKEILELAESLPRPTGPAPRLRGQRIWKGGEEALYAGSISELEDDR